MLTGRLPKFVIDGWNPAKPDPIGNENYDVWSDLDATGSLTTHYIRGDIVDQIYAQSKGTGESSFLLTDFLGSVRSTIGSDGEILDRTDYDAWGNVISEEDAEARGRYVSFPTLRSQICVSIAELPSESRDFVTPGSWQTGCSRGT